MIWDAPEDSPDGSLSYLGVSPEQWRERMARRAIRWAAEDAARRQQWETAVLARRTVRAAQWPVERIVALMTEVREQAEPRGEPRQ